MDLGTLKANLLGNVYKTKDQFKADIELIFKNAKKYNQKNTIYYKLAAELECFAGSLVTNLTYDFTDTGDDSLQKKLKVK